MNGIRYRYERDFELWIYPTFKVPDLGVDASAWPGSGFKVNGRLRRLVPCRRLIMAQRFDLRRWIGFISAHISP